MFRLFLAGLAGSLPLSVAAAELLSIPATAAPLPLNGEISQAHVSPDGRRLLFATRASNLVAGDDNGKVDVYLLDRDLGTYTLVSAGANGIGNDHSVGELSISTDGRYAVFWSAASNLVPGDTPGTLDLFRKDLHTGVIQRLPRLSPSFPRFLLSSSGDGASTWLADSEANWIPGGASDLSLLRVDWDTLTVNVQATDRPFAGLSPFPRVSADGRCLAYAGLEPDGSSRLWVRDLVAATEQFADSPVSPGVVPDGHAIKVALTPDCSYLAFTSTATNLLAEPQPPLEVYRRDLLQGELVHVSARGPGQRSTEAQTLVISPNGQGLAYGRYDYLNLVDPIRKIEYADLASGQRTLLGQWPDFVIPVAVSDAGELLALGEANDPANSSQLTSIYRLDAPTGTPAELTVPPQPLIAAGGNGASHASFATRISSRDQSVLVYSSSASNLDPDDPGGDGIQDLYIKTPADPHPRKLLAPGGQQPNGASAVLDLSSDGRFVLFRSCASNLVAGDTNGVCDVFLLDRQSQQLERVNVSSTGQQADVEGYFPSPARVSDDGRFVVFESLSTNLVQPSTPEPERRWLVRDRLAHSTSVLGGILLGADTGFAPGNALALVYVESWSGLPGCRVIGLQLATGAAECIPIGPYGAILDILGNIAVSNDGRIVVFQTFGSRAELYVRDLKAGVTRSLQGLGPPDDLPRLILSGNGRYLGLVSSQPVNFTAVVVDLILELPVTTRQAVPYDVVFSFDGDWMYLSTEEPLSPLDQNGFITDLYRLPTSGEGLFGGGWQGGFE